MRLTSDAATQQSATVSAAGSGGAGGGTIVMLLLMGVVVGGGISFALYKMRPPERNPKSRLGDGPDTPGEVELERANGERDPDADL